MNTTDLTPEMLAGLRALLSATTCRPEVDRDTLTALLNAAERTLLLEEVRRLTGDSLANLCPSGGDWIVLYGTGRALRGGVGPTELEALRAAVRALSSATPKDPTE